MTESARAGADNRDVRVPLRPRLHQPGVFMSLSFRFRSPKLTVYRDARFRVKGKVLMQGSEFRQNPTLAQFTTGAPDFQVLEVNVD